MQLYAPIEVPGADVYVSMDSWEGIYTVKAWQNVYPNELSGKYKGVVRSRAWKYRSEESARRLFAVLSTAMIHTFANWQRT